MLKVFNMPHFTFEHLSQNKLTQQNSLPNFMPMSLSLPRECLERGAYSPSTTPKSLHFGIRIQGLCSASSPLASAGFALITWWPPKALCSPGLVLLTFLSLLWPFLSSLWCSSTPDLLLWGLLPGSVCGSLSTSFSPEFLEAPLHCRAAL